MRFELSRGASRGQTRGGRGGRGGRGWNNSKRYFQNDVNRRQAQDNRFKIDILFMGPRTMMLL